MERSTKELKTKGGHLVVLHEHMTGREARALRNALASKANLTPGVGIESLSPEALELWENEAIKALVVSVDGETDNLIDRVLDLPAADYTEVFVAIQAAQGEIRADEKKG